MGPPVTLTEEVAQRILSEVPRGLVVGQVARLSRTPGTTLKRWLKKGLDDAVNGQSSIFAHLWLEFETLRGVEITKMLEYVQSAGKNWQGPWEVLKAVAREDFGTEAIEYKELVEMFAKLSQDFKQIQSGAMKQLGEPKDGD